MAKLSVRRRSSCLVVIVALAGAGLVGHVADASAAPIPLPTSDPFYSVPSGVAGLANGTIIKSRPVSATTFSLPLPVKAWQVQYKTLNSENQPTADVTTVMVPLVPWLGKGPRPLVSYQTAEDGVGSKCAPSYALRAGLADASANSELETPIMALALLQGWAVAAPDYEGPNSAFLGGPGEAHGVLDGVRAAQHFTASGLGTSTPVALWGYSGGSLATAEAAQIQSTYAPDLHFAGIALGGLVADINATINDFSGSFAGGAIPVGIVGMERAYPDANLGQYLNARGNADVAAAQNDCLTDAASQFPGLSVSQIEATPGALELPQVQALIKANSPDGIPGTPTAPVYDYHSLNDEFAPLTNDRQQMTRYCAAGATVQHVEDLPSEHISEVAVGAPGAIAFLTERFAGLAPINNCATIPAS